MAPVASSGGANPIDVEAGASGEDSSSIQVSSGVIIAIGVVVGVVVILGAISTILFIIAKRRNWEVRKSIARMSKRLTGSAARERKARRHGTVRMTSPPSSTRAPDRAHGTNGKTAGTAEKPARTEKKPTAIMPPPYSERGT